MRFALIAVLSVFSIVQEGATLPKPKESPQWYDKIVGVIAIPAGLIGCAYSYLLIKKTRLESQKIELELEEKRQQLSRTQPPDSVTGQRDTFLGVSATIEEALKNRLYLLLLIRYVLWQLVNECYSWLIKPLEWMSNTGYTLFALFASKRFDLSGIEKYFQRHELIAVPVVFVAQTFPRIIFDAGFFVIFLAFGWPLFKDINRVIGIKWADYRPMKLIRAAFRGKQAASQSGTP